MKTSKIRRLGWHGELWERSGMKGLTTVSWYWLEKPYTKISMLQWIILLQKTFNWMTQAPSSFITSWTEIRMCWNNIINPSFWSQYHVITNTSFSFITLLNVVECSIHLNGPSKRSVVKYFILVPCPYEACIPIEKWEVKQLFHGWPNKVVFEGGTSGI